MCEKYIAEPGPTTDPDGKELPPGSGTGTTVEWVFSIALNALLKFNN